MHDCPRLSNLRPPPQVDPRRPKRISTSNLIGHLEEMSETCQAHAAALDDVRENSKGYCLTAAGEYVQKCTEGVFLRDEH